MSDLINIITCDVKKWLSSTNKAKITAVDDTIAIDYIIHSKIKARIIIHISNSIEFHTLCYIWTYGEFKAHTSFPSLHNSINICEYDNEFLNILNEHIRFCNDIDRFVDDIKGALL